MNNKKNIKDTLIHRIKILNSLMNEFNIHRILLPEIFLRTLRDTHKIETQTEAYGSIPELAKELGIIYTIEENQLIQELETSLRKQKEYHEICQHFNENLFRSISDKLENFLSA